jgi:tetratricopeptide (TPR) repeat protein
MSFRCVGFALPVAASLLLPARDAVSAEQLGAVSFANTCEAAVQSKLERAVALLHSFWWREGRDAFREVIAQDGSCAIAAWGAATIEIGNPFSSGPTPQQARQAQEAIAQGRAMAAKSERERGYVEAVAAYYDHFAERTHAARMRSLSDAFEALAKRFADDDETQIFSALYLVATQPPEDKTFARALRGAAILQGQFIKHPDHPGVAHYLIHSYDFPPLADSGLPAAMCYADIAPSAPHALHMPSHIFTRVGLWKSSDAMNRRSITAARAGGDRAEELHALDYLVYADLQLARDKDARAGLEEASAIADPTLAAAYSRSAIPARFAIERGMWREAASLPDPDTSKFPFTEAIRFFARSLGAARSGDIAAARNDAERLKRIAGELRSANNGYWAGEVEVQSLAANAWIVFGQGHPEDALKLMRSAADLEDLSEKSAVSPGRLIPARELLGDMLMESGNPASALVEYESSQKRDPKRFRGLWGAGQAALQIGDTTKAREYFTRLVEMTNGGDQRPELAKAAQYLSAK